MRLIDAEHRLLALKVPVLFTDDVAACLQVTPMYASQILGRLCKANVFVQLIRGKWAVSKNINPLLLPEYLTAPFPSYVSLQTALYHQGMISQIPNTVYAVTIGRTHIYHTPLGKISVHHIDPHFFFGYDWVGASDVKMASPEKALLDVFYLTGARSNLFKKLPEIEIPKKFNVRSVHTMVKKIPSKRIQSIVIKRLKDYID